MRLIQQGAGTLAVIALVGSTAAAQERRPERLGDSVERTIEAFAGLIEHNVERWAKTVERNAERWADEFERHAEKWAEEIERHAEDIAITVEIEAADQSSEAAREARERAREQREEALERARERREREQERAQEQRERQREQAQEQRQRQRELERERRDRRDARELTEQVSRTARLGRTGIIDVETQSGDITITGGSGTDVRIEATKRVRNSDDARARALLSELRVDVNERPGRVDVRTFHPRGRNSGGQIDFIVTVPNGADVFVKTMSGDVRVTSVRGELRAETMSGDVSVTGASRIQSAKTMSGDLQITDAEGEVTGSTMSGDVILRNIKGRSLNIGTVSGDLVLTDIDVERADVGSINGDVDFSGRLQKGGRYELHTHQGDVRLTPMASSQGFDVEGSTFNGDIVSQYALKLTQETEAGARRGVNKSIRGTFGDASAFVSLKSFNGDITIIRR